MHERADRFKGRISPKSGDICLENVTLILLLSSLNDIRTPVHCGSGSTLPGEKRPLNYWTTREWDTTEKEKEEQVQGICT